MRTGRRFAAAAAAMLAYASLARAHELACEKLVKLASSEGPGAPLLQISNFPAEVVWTWTVFNVNPTDTSVLTSISDTQFQPTPLTVNVAIPVGEAVSQSATVTFQTFEDCEKFATSQEANGAVDIDNRLTAMWDFGEAQCTARVVCVPPTPPPPQITCAKTVDGKGLEEIQTYPATLHYAVSVSNTGGSSATITSASDSFLGSLMPAFAFTPTPPFPLAAGATTQPATYDLPIESYDACRALATSCTCDGTTAPPTNGMCADGCVANLENVFTVGWDSKTATCSAGVKCFPPTVTPPQVTCTKTIDDTDTVTVTTYPATVTYDVTITNTGTTAATVTSATDPNVPTITFATPLDIAAGASVSATGTLTVTSFSECQALQTSVANGNAIFDNTFTVSWDSTSTTCTARLVCVPPPLTGATRTMGFFKTHEQADLACLASGPIDLGLDGSIGTIDTLQEFLALLWTSPAQFTGLDKARFLLARQTLVAVCNERLFGTTSDVIADALTALQTCSTDVSLLMSLEGQVDAFNNSGDENAFPAGFTPGPATPKDAQAKASIITSADLACTP
jgi:hypothetical protein